MGDTSLRPRHNSPIATPELTRVLLALLALTGAAHLLGYLALRLRQPKVIGELAAGVLLGPAVLGRWPPVAGVFQGLSSPGQVLDLAYSLGLLLLMFLSGSEVRQLFSRGDRRALAWLTGVGTGLPFVLGLLAAPRVAHLPGLPGPRGNLFSLTLVLGVSAAVTSVPVLSKIFADLQLLGTRFARLVLSMAVLEDLVLWLALALATASAGQLAPAPALLARHILVTATFFAGGLLLVPALLRALAGTPLAALALYSPVGWAVGVLLAFSVLAGLLNVSLMFGAFLAGIALVRADPLTSQAALPAISRFSFGFPIPLYFALVGFRLDLLRGFSLALTLWFLLATCAVKMLSIAVAGRLAGFRGRPLLHLALTTNARGGPGIVLASAALAAGIISPRFATTLVLAAVLTSQMAGAWLALAIRRGWSLLGD